MRHHIAALGFLVWVVRSTSLARPGPSTTAGSYAQMDSSNWLTTAAITAISVSRRSNRSTRVTSKVCTRLDVQERCDFRLPNHAIVADGVMYLSLPFNHVVALDARRARSCGAISTSGARTRCVRSRQSRRGGGLRQGDHRHGGCAPDRPGSGQRQPVWDVPLVEELDGETEKTEQFGADDPLRKSSVSGSTGVGANMAPLIYKGRGNHRHHGRGLRIASRYRPCGGAARGSSWYRGTKPARGLLRSIRCRHGKEHMAVRFHPGTGWEGEFIETTAESATLDRDLATKRAAMAQYPEAASRGGGSAWTTPAVDPRKTALCRRRQSLAADG